MLMAVFSMRRVRGFDDHIPEALKSSDPEIEYEAVKAALVIPQRPGAPLKRHLCSSKLNEWPPSKPKSSFSGKPRRMMTSTDSRSEP
jgi:hypothetical protein